MTIGVKIKAKGDCSHLHYVKMGMRSQCCNGALSDYVGLLNNTSFFDGTNHRRASPQKIRASSRPLGAPIKSQIHRKFKRGPCLNLVKLTVIDDDWTDEPIFFFFSRVSIRKLDSR